MHVQRFLAALLVSATMASGQQFDPPSVTHSTPPGATRERSSDHWVVAPLLETTGTPASDFSAAYQLALRVLDFNLRGGLLEAGEGYGTWTRDTAINSWNAASLLMPDVAERSLWHETEITPTGVQVSGQYWDKVIWIIAAKNHAYVTGDLQFSKRAYETAINTLEAMRGEEFDSSRGLFRGPAVYGDGVAAYPDPPFDDLRGDNVRDYAESGQLEVLSTNCVYYGAYLSAEALGRMSGAPQDEVASLEKAADSLRENIQRELWIPPAHRFAYFLDAQDHQDQTQEGLGQAFAILLGVANQEQTKEILRYAEETPWGIACTWPPYARYKDESHASFGRHNGTIWPFINAFWATAAAEAGSEKIFAKELQSVATLALRSGDFREIYHPYSGKPYGGVQTQKTWDSVRHQSWSASGYLRMIYAGLFGMNFEEDGILFRPMIPASLGIRSMQLRGLTYRMQTVDISVRGTGDRIATVKIDGIAQQGAFLPSSLTGPHTVEIVLAKVKTAKNGNRSLRRRSR